MERKLRVVANLRELDLDLHNIQVFLRYDVKFVGHTDVQPENIQLTVPHCGTNCAHDICLDVHSSCYSTQQCVQERGQ